ncbi:hypothetical protein [Pseudomonas phage vB_PaeM_PAO1_Ab06]|uniref:Uncharacterized protein n=1 Tax=Pseudomonas phage vB_PaeM_PAO1_Ab06 TaxID=1548910 RepID=A0A0C7U011_9CAUD|nr:hypothetical protein [Pseudomonas phage vB_PaeM_PAO1_Ab06]
MGVVMGFLAGDILLLGWGMVTQLPWLRLSGDPGMQGRYTMGHDHGQAVT